MLFTVLFLSPYHADGKVSNNDNNKGMLWKEKHSVNGKAHPNKPQPKSYMNRQKKFFFSLFEQRREAKVTKKKYVIQI